VAVDELLLRCSTTSGIVEKRVQRDSVDVSVSAAVVVASFAHTTPSSSFQLSDMGLTEVPSDLFLLTDCEQLFLFNNCLCSLPSDIWRLTKLSMLSVRWRGGR
jgi:hypothetical protein